MTDVLTPATRSVWMCPDCGHGSPDPRDERAHLDAHRQLHAFFREWDAGTEPVQRVAGRNGRPRMLLVAGVTALVLLASVMVFSRINGSPDAFKAPAPAPALVSPTAEQPATRAEVPLPPSPTASTVPVQAAPVRTVAAPTAPSPGTVPVALAPTATVPQATSPALAPSAEPAALAPPVAHLISACVLTICISVL